MGFVERTVKPHFTLHLQMKTGIMYSLLLMFSERFVYWKKRFTVIWTGACMPVRAVSVSSRNPPWMTPLLKSMIRTKSRVSSLSKDRLCLINKRIAGIILENRTKFMAAPPGSRGWWKGVDESLQRCRASCKSKPRWKQFGGIEWLLC